MSENPRRRASMVAGLPLAVLLGDASLVPLAWAEPDPVPSSGQIYSLGTLGPIDPISFTWHIGADNFDVHVPVSNIGIAGAAEGLNIAFGPITSSVPNDVAWRLALNFSAVSITPDLRVTNLAAGGTGALTIGVVPEGIGGVLSGTIDVLVQSNGSGTSGNGLTTLPRTPVPITAVAIPSAKGSINTPGPIDFGAVRVGSSIAPVGLSISNVAVPTPSADLLVSHGLGLIGSGITATGGFGVVGGGTAAGNLAPGDVNIGGVKVGIDTATGGVKSGTVQVGFASDASASGYPLTTPSPGSIKASGTVYDLAAPVTKTASISLTGRTGMLSQAATITAQNKAAASGFTEDLRGAIVSASAGLQIGPPTGLISAGATGAVGSLGLLTNTSGTISGTAHVSYASTGVSGERGATSDVPLGSVDIPVSGTVYQTATAAVTPISFGIVHQNDVVTRPIPIFNAANGVINDSLAARVEQTTGAFQTANDTVSGIQAGARPGLNTPLVTMNTGTAGVFNSGSVVLAFTSQNPVLPDLGIGTKPVALTGQVNNYASIGLGFASVGTISGAGGNLFLHGGRFPGPGQAGALVSAIQVLNTAFGLADDLTIADVRKVSGGGLTAGFAGASDIAPGNADGRILFFLSSALSGTFTETFELIGSGTNASGYDSAENIASIFLTVDVTVGENQLPEPATLISLLAGLLGLAAIRRGGPGSTGRAA